MARESIPSPAALRQLLTDAPLPVLDASGPARPVWPVASPALDALHARLTAPQAAFLRQSGFAGAAAEVVLLPGPDGVAGAVLGLGPGTAPHPFGALARSLPEGDWALQPGGFDMGDAVLWHCLGAYHYGAFKGPKRPAARLAVDRADPAVRQALATAAAVWMARDLINEPANVLGPAQLADAAQVLAEGYGAAFRRTEGAALADAYPAVAAVGAGADRPPVVAHFAWQGSGAGADSPLVSLCGKGVCFDSGGYDIKPSSGMLRMKKDMGGAATVLGLARTLMEADLPIRLAVRIGCVENSISGRAMRPLDVLRTRRGFSVEVGNTDAEGRLVLCDLLAEASDEHPALLVDCATLTGAARVALGPELPALFCNDDGWAAELLSAGGAAHDPLWRLPLWGGYDGWLDSAVADLNNVSDKPMAGAVTAALFMQRFIAPSTSWAHIDLYAWNDASRPGRPAGGEAQAMRALATAIGSRFGRAADRALDRPKQDNNVIDAP